MKVTIGDGRVFDFEDIEKREDIKKMTDDELDDWYTDIINEREDYDDMDDWGLVLDEVEMLIDNERSYRKEHPHLKNDFLALIIDNIEDWLDTKGVIIPNDERDQSGDSGAANIWGEDFDELMEMMRNVCAENGIIVDDEWEN